MLGTHCVHLLCASPPGQVTPGVAQTACTSLSLVKSELQELPTAQSLWAPRGPSVKWGQLWSVVSHR